MKDVLINNLEWVIGVIAAIITWYGGRKHLLQTQTKQADANLDYSKLGNISSTFKVYQDLISDLEVRFKDRIKELEDDLAKMKLLNEELRKHISNQERYIKKLTTKLQTYENLDEE